MNRYLNLECESSIFQKCEKSFVVITSGQEFVLMVAQIWLLHGENLWMRIFIQKASWKSNASIFWGIFSFLCKIIPDDLLHPISAALKRSIKSHTSAPNYPYWIGMAMIQAKEGSKRYQIHFQLFFNAIHCHHFSLYVSFCYLFLSFVQTIPFSFCQTRVKNTFCL